MKLDQLQKEFIQAQVVLKRLQSEGFEAYFVGGSVRDALLGRPIHDIDIATSAYPEEVKHVFKKTFDLGIEHGTVLVLSGKQQYEVTTFRTESKYTDYRRPDKVKFVSDLTEDLKRRDFTVNAFAMTVDGEIIDVFDALSDLENKILRAVGKAEERFNEDALRIMRGMRFAADLDFDIEDETFEAMKSHAKLLPKISIERIFVELEKLMLSPNWRKGLRTLNQSEAFKYLPGFEELDLNDFSEDYQFKSSEQAWALLYLKFHTFDLKAWKVSNDFNKKTKLIVKAYYEKAWTLENIYSYGLEIAQLADDLKFGQGLELDLSIPQNIYDLLQIHSKSEILVKGADLIKEGHPPGPSLGQLLNKIELNIVNNKLKNQKEEILAYVKTISC
ncbi:CCA tRNA nucleotidyltransferase [Lactovum miscens]|uniref:CCA-adding enzyme n=1 Tax=Lactovum miscens TaxID=190387 RepID=A0A841C9R4_9LACT|nr:CCA tRNA nucleotidyltransferase [Lactovum miscens]MBB5887930.1 tRNA nucleotidyltransferase (CCA-adding enzyme) [Lactovum miscens]